jgi:hypothetical protein
MDYREHDKFIVEWQTVKSPGLEFYSGEEEVYAISSTDAEVHVKRIIGSQFRDRGGPNAIIVTSVHEA